MENIRLEFSEQQQCFQFEYIYKDNFNTNGYICISPYIEREKAIEFTKKVWGRYDKPTLKQVQEMFSSESDYQKELRERQQAITAEFNEIYNE